LGGQVKGGTCQLLLLVLHYLCGEAANNGGKHVSKLDPMAEGEDMLESCGAADMIVKSRRLSSKTELMGVHAAVYSEEEGC
jgi:hypothetical protein